MNLDTKRKDPPVQDGSLGAGQRMEAARLRSRQLGHLAGRETYEVSQEDYEQAKQEQSLAMLAKPETKKEIPWTGPEHPHLPLHGRAERAGQTLRLNKQGTGGVGARENSTQPMKLWRRKQG